MAKPAMCPKRGSLMETAEGRIWQRHAEWYTRTEGAVCDEDECEKEMDGFPERVSDGGERFRLCQ